MRLYSAERIAKWFLSYNEFQKYLYDKEGLTIEELQELLYYAQSFHLMFWNEPLFEEAIEVRHKSPFISSVYERYKEFGSSLIPAESSLSIYGIDEDVKGILEFTYEFVMETPEDSLKQELPLIKAEETGTSFLDPNFLKTCFDELYKDYLFDTEEDFI